MENGKLIDILQQWDRNVEIVIDIAPAIEGCETDYQWHDFEAFEPSKQEKIMGATRDTFTTLKVTPEVLGC